MVRGRTVRLALATALAAIVAGCGGGATSPGAPSSGVTPSIQPGAAPPSATPSGPPASAAASCVTLGSGVYPHEVAGLEAMLPASVAGRSLARWSLGGRCWIETATGLTANAFLAQAAGSGSLPPIDLANLGYGVAGRSMTTDPPYFVFVCLRPVSEAELELSQALLFGGAGFHDVASAASGVGFAKRTVGGKDVEVGTAEMLDQSIHQRGRPYLYATNAFIFLVVTDDDAWAADALSQLIARGGG